jgi:YidC/Oxa1 family membrane protein insertase
MFDPIYKAIGWLLSLFYAAVPNLGISIILLTFTIMLLLYPLTAKQARSMIAMQMVQPEIKRIQAKYKNDRAKLNEEMMKFYQENKINPLAGCLPLLVQLPIFFALFQVLRNPYKWVPFDSKLYEAFCTTNQGRVVSVKTCGDGPFNYLPTHQKFLGIDLSVTAPNQITTWATIASFALVILVMFTGYMQSRQAQKRTPAVNKQMAMITKVLPLIFGFFSLNFPAGLVLYFFVSNLWRLGQQEVIFRRFGTAANPKHRSLMNPPKAKVIDAESRERTDTATDVLEVEAGPEEAQKPAGGSAKGRAKAGAKPATSSTAKSSGKSTGPGDGAKAVAPPPKSGGGLRSLFQLPPPPGEVPKSAPAPTPRKSSSSSTSKSSSSSPSARPGQAGRRTSKKKRKR